jgi:hypothetical protein
MNALFKLVLSSILAKRVKFFYLHPRLGGGAQCAAWSSKRDTRQSVCTMNNCQCVDV